jgi:hypothetical protein
MQLSHVGDGRAITPEVTAPTRTQCVVFVFDLISGGGEGTSAALIDSQNGVWCVGDAMSALRDRFGETRAGLRAPSTHGTQALRCSSFWTAVQDADHRPKGTQC